MEFELLDNPENPPGPLESLRRFLMGPRKQMAAWGDRIPTFSAAMVFALVVVEWVVAGRVARGAGPGPSAVVQALTTAAVLLGAQSLLTASAAGIATLSGKTGSRKSALAYLNLSMTPLLLILPLTLLCEAAQTPAVVRLLVILLLVVKVAGAWREAVEVTFKLNKLQSAVAMYGAASAAVGILFLFIYAAAVGRIASALS